MKKIVIIFVGVFLLLAENRPLIAGGVLKRLQGIAENMALQEDALDKEAENYRKAEEFIDSQEIRKGLSSDFILGRCGQPVARASQGRRWVYKPRGSTFFRGEKIYLIFDENERLVSWEKLLQ